MMKVLFLYIKAKLKSNNNFLFFLALMLIWIAFYARVFIGHRYIGWDLDSFHYPLERVLFDGLKNNHSIPQLDPYSFNGTDFTSNIQTALFYPPKLILYFLLIVFKIDLSFSIYTIFNLIHIFLFSCFCFILIKKSLSNKWIALFGAILLSYNGFFQGQLQHFWFAASICWMPLLLLALNSWIIDGKKISKYLVLITIFFILTVGYPLLDFLIIGISLLVFILFILYQKKKSNKEIFITSLRIGYITLLGIFLSGITLVPFLYYIQNYNPQSLRLNMPPLSLVTFILPNLKGHVWGNYTGKWEISTSYYFSGISTILLPFVTIFLILKRQLNLKKILMLFSSTAILFFYTYSKASYEIGKKVEFISLFRPWMIAIALVGLVLSFQIYCYSRLVLAKNLKRLGYFIITVSTLSLLIINLPSNYNSLHGSSMDIDKDNFQIINRSVTDTITKDGINNSVLIDFRIATIYGGNYMSWSSVLKYRSLGGYAPSISQIYGSDLGQLGVDMIDPGVFYVKKINSFDKLRQSGVRYVISTKEILPSDYQNSTSTLYEDASNDVVVLDLLDARPIFSLECNTGELTYTFNGSEFQINNLNNEEDISCPILSTMNFSDELVASKGEIQELDGLGFKIDNFQPTNKLIIRYENPYYLYGKSLTAFASVIILIELFFSSKLIKRIKFINV